MLVKFEVVPNYLNLVKNSHLDVQKNKAKYDQFWVAQLLEVCVCARARACVE